MTETLVASLDELLEKAIRCASTEEASERLTEARRRLLGPLRLAIAGMVKAGKSTLLNAIVGEELAATDAGECTKVVSWYHWGNTPQVTVHPHGREPVLRPWSRQSGALEVDLTGLAAADVDRIDVALADEPAAGPDHPGHARASLRSRRTSPSAPIACWRPMTGGCP